MPAPAVSTDHAPAPSATSLEQDIGQLFGDYSSGAESPEPEDSAAGTTPAEPSEGTEPDAGTEPAPTDGDDAPDLEREGTTPDATSVAIDEDPWKDTTAAMYVVNGKTLSSEDIRVFKEGGAAIRPEALPNVLSKLAERDTLSERIRVRDQEYQTLAKVAEWTDPAGKTYSGPDAAIEMRIGNASLFAENSLMLPVLTAEDVKPYLTTLPILDARGQAVIGPDGSPAERIVFRPDFLESLSEKARFQKEQIEFATRKHYAGVMAEASKPQAPAIDYDAAAPQLMHQVATAAKLDASVLTPADRTMLAKQLPFHVRDGNASLAWQDLVKERIALRAEQKASAQSLVTSTTAATKVTQNRMLAAARGVKPVQRPVVPAPKPPTPQQERLTSEGDLYDSMERASAQALRAAR